MYSIFSKERHGDHFWKNVTQIQVRMRYQSVVAMTTAEAEASDVTWTLRVHVQQERRATNW